MNFISTNPISHIRTSRRTLPLRSSSDAINTRCSIAAGRSTRSRNNLERMVQSAPGQFESYNRLVETAVKVIWF